MSKVRPLTAVDRMLAWVGGAYFESEPKRRTHERFGQLDVVVVEQGGESTVVYLTNDEGVIVEARAWELLEAADFLQAVMAETLARRSR